MGKKSSAANFPKSTKNPSSSSPVSSSPKSPISINPSVTPPSDGDEEDGRSSGIIDEKADLAADVAEKVEVNYAIGDVTTLKEKGATFNGATESTGDGKVDGGVAPRKPIPQRNLLSFGNQGKAQSSSSVVTPVIGEISPEIKSGWGKLFIAGISRETDEMKLHQYFANFGSIVQTIVVRDRVTGNSKGFGFVTFSDYSTSEQVLEVQHKIDGCRVEVKRAFSRKECLISGLRPSSPPNSGDVVGVACMPAPVPHTLDLSPEGTDRGNTPVTE